MKLVKYLFFVFLALIVLIFILAAVFLVVAANLPSKPVTFVNEQLVFENKLIIPKLLEPRVENGTKFFDLSIQAGETEFLPSKKAATFGFNGSYLGPTLRARMGDRIQIQVTNQLTEKTTVHWHGMSLPALMDGGPHNVIQPSEIWRPTWTITNAAATLWYHPHLMEKTGEQVYRGLAGFFIIDDDNTETLNLPKQYGFDDIPLVIQDRQFSSSGQLVYQPKHSRIIDPGMLGDTILVNGTRAPYAEVPAKLVRLRLLNGSNARRYYFGFSDDRKFFQIASDGGLLPSPVEMTRLLLTPGERAEILVDLSGVETPVTLLSYEIVEDVHPSIELFQRIFLPDNDEHQKFKILELRPRSGEYSPQDIPSQLTELIKPTEVEAKFTRRFSLDFSSRTINLKAMDPTRIDEVVYKRQTEIWEVRNESISYHPFHVHGVQFQILERNRREPPLSEQAWKDTVNIAPAETVRLIMKFDRYADPSTPYMFHCHILEHEDMGMMGQFVVIDSDTTEPLKKIRIESEEKMEPMGH